MNTQAKIEATALAALALALPLLREDLRSLIECEAIGGETAAHGAEAIRFDDGVAAEVAGLINAIRAAEAVLPRASDSGPGWLNAVIDGKREVWS